MNKILIVLFVLLLQGCSLLYKDRIIHVPDPSCKAIQTVPYVPTEPQLILTESQSIEVKAVKKEEIRIIEMSVEDFELIVKVLTKTENFIATQTKEIQNMKKHYSAHKE